MSSGYLRIMHLTRAPLGGIMRHIEDLARAQSAMGHEVALLTDQSYLGSEFDRTPFTAGVVHTAIRRSAGIGDLASAFNVRRKLSRFNPDIIHMHGAKAGAYGRLAACGSRTGSTVYSPHGGVSHLPSTLPNRLFFSIERFLFRFTDSMIFVSAAERDAFVSKIGSPDCSIHVVRNGLRATEFQDLRASPQYDFTYMGHLRDLKGLDIFIEALGLLWAQDIPFRARIAGPGTPAALAHYAQLLQRHNIADYVVLTGVAPRGELLASSRCIVVPSRQEALGYTLLEAAAAGIPLIGTNVGGIPEVFGPTASSLIPPDDPLPLAAVMKDFLSNPARFAEEANTRKEHVAAAFTFESMTSQTMEIYASIGAG